MAEQISATVLKLGTNPLLLTPQDWSFPTKDIAMEEVIDGDINASISWQGTTYYVSETLADLITAANAGGGGGSSYLSFESYQNSAMSVAVDCFVWRDLTLAIWKVYEPTRDNTVSRSQLAYADTIDKFQFDNEDWFDNVLSDMQLDSLHSSFVMQQSTATAGIIYGNNRTGCSLVQCTVLPDVEIQYWFNDSLCELCQLVSCTLNVPKTYAISIVMTYGTNRFRGTTDYEVVYKDLGTDTIGIVGDQTGIFNGTYFIANGVNNQLPFTISSISFNGGDNRTEIIVAEGVADIPIGVSLFTAFYINSMTTCFWFNSKILPTADNIDLTEYVIYNTGTSGSPLAINSSINKESLIPNLNSGINTSFTDNDGNTITVTKGIITAITAP